MPRTTTSSGPTHVRPPHRHGRTSPLRALLVTTAAGAALLVASPVPAEALVEDLVEGLVDEVLEGDLGDGLLGADGPISIQVGEDGSLDAGVNLDGVVGADLRWDGIQSPFDANEGVADGIGVDASTDLVGFGELEVDLQVVEGAATGGTCVEFLAPGDTDCGQGEGLVGMRLGSTSLLSPDGIASGLDATGELLGLSTQLCARLDLGEARIRPCPASPLDPTHPDELDPTAPAPFRTIRVNEATNPGPGGVGLARRDDGGSEDAVFPSAPASRRVTLPLTGSDPLTLVGLGSLLLGAGVSVSGLVRTKVRSR